MWARYALRMQQQAMAASAPGQGSQMTQAPSAPHLQVQATSSEQQCYLNAGETGGNYEGVNEDHSGSSYFSSACKKQGA